MYLSVLSVASALILAATASPLRDASNTVFRRAGTSTCSGLTTTTTTVGGSELTVTGPFHITAQGEFDQTGYYAQASDATINFQIVFDVNPSKADDTATQFWLNQNSRLVSIQNDIVYHAYNPPVDDAGYSDIAMSEEKKVYDKLVCEISDSCGLTCSAVKSGFAYNCLASPKYQPDWRISSSKSGSGPGCVDFTATVHPL